MNWRTDGASPVYMQLAESIRHAIICEEYPPGSRIASVRELSADAKVNPNTMQRALFELEREGLIETHGTTGKYVTSDDKILEAARRRALSELVADFESRARSLGYTTDEVIKIIEERKDTE